MGCGTGQATASLLARGWTPRCLEPGADLARLFRAKFPDVPIEVTDFESWEPDGRYDLLLAASSWHWVDPALKYEKARSVADRLALMWTWPATFQAGFHQRVQEAYAAHWPDYRGDPDTLDTRVAAICDEIAGDVQVVRAESSRHFDAPTYLRLMNTWSDHRALPDKHRVPLEEHVARLIGDGAVIDYVSALFLA